MNTRRLLVVAMVAAAGTAVPSAAFGQAAFHHLGDLPGGRAYSGALAVSGDGRVVVGDSVTGGIPFFDVGSAFRWTLEEGSVELDPAYAEWTTQPYAANYDGSVVGGQVVFVPINVDIEAFLWQRGTGQFDILDDLPGGRTNGSIHALSRDGRAAAGIGVSVTADESCLNCMEAFRWTPADGMVPLGDLDGGVFDSRALGISGDGSVIVGQATTDIGPVAYSWTAITGMVPLPYLNAAGTRQAAAYGISDNGHVIIGFSSSDRTVEGEACRWTMDDAAPEGLGDLPGGPFISRAWGVSGDGSVIVGQGMIEGGIFGAGQIRAFIWDHAHGMRNLHDVLIADHGLGPALEGWTLLSARGISVDGRTIVGLGVNPEGTGEGWVVKLAASCPADFNGDGVIDFGDYLEFLNLYDALDPRADLNPDGVVDFGDYLEFLNHYDAGC